MLVGGVCAGGLPEELPPQVRLQLSVPLRDVSTGGNCKCLKSCLFQGQLSHPIRLFVKPGQKEHFDSDGRETVNKINSSCSQ